MTEATPSAGRSFGLITIDQAIAGASNVLIAVLAARLLSVSEFGFFGLVFLVYVMAQGVSRALVCDPVLVHPDEARLRTGEIVGTSCTLALGLAVVVAVAGLGAQFWDTALGDALLVLAACLPLLVVQDLGRYLGFALQRPMSAVVLDVTWLALQLLTVAALFITDTRSLPWFILAWAGAGAVAGLLVLPQHGLRRLHPSLTWLRYTWSFSWRYLISYTSTQGAALAAAGGVGAIAGAKSLGGLQGATLLVRPFATVQTAAVAAGIGEVGRSLGQHAQLRRFVMKVSLVTASVAMLNAVVLLLLPDAAGEAVLGDSWSTARPLILPTGIQIVCLGLMTGTRAGLLGMRAIRRVMAIDVTATVLVLLATVLGAIVDGVLGALWAVSAVQAGLTVVWWLTFLHHLDTAPAEAATGTVVPVSPPVPVPIPTPPGV